jgi:hypothetical protein
MENLSLSAKPADAEAAKPMDQKKFDQLLEFALTDCNRLPTSEDRLPSFARQVLVHKMSFQHSDVLPQQLHEVISK